MCELSHSWNCQSWLISLGTQMVSWNFAVLTKLGFSKCIQNFSGYLFAQCSCSERKNATCSQSLYDTPITY